VACALRRDLLAELPRKQDRGGDILRGLGECDSRRPLIDRQVPRLPRLVEAGVLRDHKLAVQR
jgi:hypothetical protein